jgi:hypothetical protein
VEDEEVAESRPSLIGKPKWHKRLKKAQRFLSDCSMGQHYHVFFHKRRYTYGSPVCGFFSLLIYIALLYYMTIKFIAVINKSEYILVEQFKPLDLEHNNLTLYKFFDTLQLNFAVVRMDTNFQVIYDCQEFLDQDYFTAEVHNPELSLTLRVNDTLSNSSATLCYFDIFYKDMPNNLSLTDKFRINFTCPNCTLGYSVSLREYYVNQQGLY